MHLQNRVKTFLNSFILLLAFLSPHNILKATEATKSPVTNANYHYQGTMGIDTNSGLIKLNWDITIYNEDETKLVFALRNTLGNIVVTGLNVLDFHLTPIEQMGGLQSITVNLKQSTTSTPRNINITYDGILLPEPMDNKINKVGPDYVELNVDSFWFPIDMRFNQQLTSHLTVNLDQSGWQGVTGGHIQSGKAPNSLQIINEIPALDISFTLAPNFVITEGDDFKIFDLRREPVDIDKVKLAASQCYQYLNTVFAANNPLPPGRFVLHERESSGYSRYNYIALSSIAGREQSNTTGFLCHELGHYWSRHGNFNTVENWLNESFAMTLELLAVRHYFGDDAFNKRLSALYKRLEETDTIPSIWDGKNFNRRPYIVNYVKGPVLLFELEDKIGKEKFIELVQAYIIEEVSTTPDLINLLNRISDSQMSNWFKDQLALVKTPTP